MKQRGWGTSVLFSCLLQLSTVGLTRAEETLGRAVVESEEGIAAVYNDKLNGHRTACGERYNRNALTTAHKTLPCNTLVKLTHQKNKRSVKVRVNDRGPVQAGRIVDITPRAAKALGMGKHGFFHVHLTVVGHAGGAKKAKHTARHH